MLEWIARAWTSGIAFFTNTPWTTTVWLIGKPILLITVLIGLTWMTLRLRRSLLSKILRVTRLSSRQRATLESLVLSISRYALLVVALLLGLSYMGVEVGPLLAGAGIVGLVIGFGAQTMIRDFIAGFFILFENQFSVGDYVTINHQQVSGTIESINLRSTHIRTWAQQLVVIQNSEIRMTHNFNRGKMRAIIPFNVSHSTSPETIDQAIQRIADEFIATNSEFLLADEQGQWLEPPQIHGISDLGMHTTFAQYTLVALVKDEHYWPACTVLRKLLLKHLLLPVTQTAVETSTSSRP